MSDERRWKFVRFTPELALSFLTLRGDRCYDVEGIPQGARILASRYDAERDQFQMRLEHESFEPVPENGWVPEIYLTMTAVLNDSPVYVRVGPSP